MTDLDQNTPLSAERREEIRERHAAATDGPWWFDESDRTWRLHGVMGRIPALRRDGIFPDQVMNKQILKAAKCNTPYAEYWPDKADAEFIAGAWEDVRDLLAGLDSLTSTAYNQARMLSEITDACVAAEGDALRHRTQVAELSAEVQRLTSERDRAVAAAEHMADAMAKVGPAIEQAMRFAASGDAASAAAVLGDVAPEGGETP